MLCVCVLEVLQTFDYIFLINHKKFFLHCLHPFLLASRLLIHLCWLLAAFVGMLPPIDQWDSVKRLEGFCVVFPAFVHPCVHAHEQTEQIPACKNTAPQWCKNTYATPSLN